ncbi:MAG: terminase large subunit [Anaerolineales bacterium]|nr:terminase large subunit [Anaerolineales bacterium]
MPAGRLQRLACDRHLNDLQHARERGLRFDVELADRAIRFFGFLRHSKGEWAGQSFDLAEWQAFIVGSLFGWLREDGLRRFRTAYVEVPRKNGKSTLLSGIGLYLLIADDEPGAEIYTAATKRDQARITHGEAARMVKASPFLRNRIGAFRDNLHVEATHSKFEPLGADSDTMDGLNIHGAIIDELHAHKTSGVVDVLDTATGARRQPLIVEITTAGWDRQSICWQHHEYTRQIVEGLIEDDSWFGFIAAADADDDWTDERTWQKANPNYSVSVKPDDLRRKALKAQQMPAAQNSFKRLHLNIWTEQADRWMTIEAWDKCAGALDPDMLIGRECYAGLDLASTTDIAALVLVFPSDDDPTIYDVLCYFWVPAETVLQRTRSGSVPYATWVDQGLIFATEGNVIDYRAIMATLDELAQLYDIREVAYDRWGATELIQTLQDEGLEVVPFGQGFVSMSPPTKSLMTMVLSERIRHSNNPVLRWMAGNMVVREDPAGNLKPDKSKSTEKIDGMVALIMGLDRAERHENGSSVYEERDLLVI